MALGVTASAPATVPIRRTAQPLVNTTRSDASGRSSISSGSNVADGESVPSVVQVLPLTWRSIRIGAASSAASGSSTAASISSASSRPRPVSRVRAQTLPLSALTGADSSAVATSTCVGIGDRLGRRERPDQQARSTRVHLLVGIVLDRGQPHRLELQRAAPATLQAQLGLPVDDRERLLQQDTRRRGLAAGRIGERSGQRPALLLPTLRHQTR